MICRWNRIAVPYTLGDLLAAAVAALRNRGQAEARLEECARVAAASLRLPWFRVYASGREALRAVLERMPPDRNEVIIPAYTCLTVPLVVRAAGRTPVLAEIDPATLCIDPADALRRVTDRTGAVIAVHEFGNLMPRSDLRRLTADFSGLVVEDAAVAWGGRYADGTPPGHEGDYIVVSGSLGKPISACAWGGLGSRHHPIEGPGETVARNSAVASLARMSALLLFSHPLAFSLARSFIDDGVSRDRVELRFDGGRPALIDIELVMRIIASLDDLRAELSRLRRAVRAVFVAHEVATPDAGDNEVFMTRIPFESPGGVERERWRAAFRRCGIEATAPYPKSLFQVAGARHEGSYPNAVAARERLLALRLGRRALAAPDSFLAALTRAVRSAASSRGRP